MVKVARAAANLRAARRWPTDRRLWRLLREQWTITLALTPLSLLLFQQVSLVGLVPASEQRAA